MTDEHWHGLGLIVSYKPKAPLLAKNARNGAPNLLEGLRREWRCGPPAYLLYERDAPCPTVLDRRYVSGAVQQRRKWPTFPLKFT